MTSSGLRGQFLWKPHGLALGTGYGAGSELHVTVALPIAVPLEAESSGEPLGLFGLKWGDFPLRTPSVPRQPPEGFLEEHPPTTEKYTRCPCSRGFTGTFSEGQHSARPGNRTVSKTGHGCGPQGVRRLCAQ